LADQSQAACIVASNGRPEFNTPKMKCTSLRMAAPTIAGKNNAFLVLPGTELRDWFFSDECDHACGSHSSFQTDDAKGFRPAYLHYQCM